MARVRDKRVIQQSLQRYLNTLNGVGDVCRDRIYLNRRPPEDGLPAIVITTVSHQQAHCLDTGPENLRRFRGQIDVLATTYKQATEIAESIRGDEDDPRLNAMSGEIMTDHRVQSAEVGDIQDEYDKPLDARETGNHRIMLDVVLWYEERQVD
jgi:hypothetical protein